MNTPVLFLIFNRPKETQEVFSAIRRARPKRLYVVADGPRLDRPLDANLCSETRRIIDQVDWECNLYTLFRDQNLGCKKSVSTGISWFFENVEEGIILEDDCLPHPSFFDFCEVMLERYRNDTRVGHIGGANFQNGNIRSEGDYYFSNLTHVWGWASWRRVWKSYDVSMKLWPQFKNTNQLRFLFPSVKAMKHLGFAFEKTYRNYLDTWDYQLFFSNLLEGNLSIIPNVNLISNIGFSENATHTMVNNHYANLPVGEITTFHSPLIFRACVEADLYTLKIESSYWNIARSIVAESIKKLKGFYSIVGKR